MLFRNGKALSILHLNFLAYTECLMKFSLLLRNLNNLWAWYLYGLSFRILTLLEIPEGPFNSFKSDVIEPQVNGLLYWETIFPVLDSHNVKYVVIIHIISRFLNSALKGTIGPITSHWRGSIVWLTTYFQRTHCYKLIYINVYMNIYRWNK